MTQVRGDSGWQQGFMNGGVWPGKDGILNIVCMWKQEFGKRGPKNDFKFLA